MTGFSEKVRSRRIVILHGQIGFRAAYVRDRYCLVRGAIHESFNVPRKNSVIEKCRKDHSGSRRTRVFRGVVRTSCTEYRDLYRIMRISW